MPNDDPVPFGRPLSRRSFLRSAAVGAGAALAGGAINSVPALAGEEQGGTATLSAFPITYVSAPLSLEGFVTLNVTKQRTDTIKLSSQVDQTIQLSFDQSVSGFGITLGSGQTIKQSTSTAVASAVTVRDTQAQAWTSQARMGSDGYATIDDTTFACVFNPQVGFSGNLASGFKFKLVSASSILICNAGNLSPSDTQGFYAALGATTAAAIRSIYPLQPGMVSGQQLGLSKPRFKFKRLIVAGPSSSPYDYANTVDSGSTISVTTTATLSIEIRQSVGFTSTDPTTMVKLQQMFGLGRTIQLTVAGTQEQTNQTIYTTSGRLFNDRAALVHFRYVDRLWKTDLLTLEGPLTSFPTALTATVVNPDGTPMQGAIVGIVNGGETYEAVTDASGACTVVSPQALPSGTYTVTCGDQSSALSLGGGVIRHTTFQPDPDLARIPPAGQTLIV